jgi:hypothetical protein
MTDHLNINEWDSLIAIEKKTFVNWVVISAIHCLYFDVKSYSLSCGNAPYIVWTFHYGWNFDFRAQKKQWKYKVIGRTFHRRANRLILVKSIIV